MLQRVEFLFVNLYKHYKIFLLLGFVTIFIWNCNTYSATGNTLWHHYYFFLERFYSKNFNTYQIDYYSNHSFSRIRDNDYRDYCDNILQNNYVSQNHFKRNVIINGRLRSNFITSVKNMGLTKHDIYTIIKALEWQLNLNKLHKGDPFSILMEKEFINGKNTKNTLIGIRLHTGKKDYYAFRAKNGNFYNCDAIKSSYGFMRYPILKKTYITSNFNLNRYNPITGCIAPHRGVDLAVPIGTAVLTVGDGKVVAVGNDYAAGKYITIHHDHQYMTRYMHLKKFLVKPGQIVKRGDCIALSGNTGRSTGPHLHFELWINQKAVNPITTPLPSHRDSLSGNERLEYLLEVKRLLPQLKFN
ncbi:murein DD-endopeptidase MepM [Candidatus Schneideria nysicola]|uniref:murein DD-endopeptidase MepM n=1 Tax=Candidatus Schneideria nysicola TaxID=1081631 RepID=UPI001CAA42DD|nr:murein DD-endopeptidase MepM [Candidatus Schneideria nysicola]UAJ65961.1 murein DD-endopeptidase MepM [Candidatus Schneideria nysicola]